MRRWFLAVSPFAVAAFVVAACGSSRLTTPTRATLPETTPHPPILTLTSTGVEPREGHFGDPTELTIVNADSRPHAIYADDHPGHAHYPGCDMLNVGELAPGERRVVPPPTHVVCFYHDETDPSNAAYQGFFISH
jgi:hypothetical protein